MTDTAILGLNRQTVGNFAATDYLPLARVSDTTDYKVQLQDLIFTAMSAGILPPTAPQGRLSLSAVPVMITDVAGATAINYLPYVGSWVPIYGTLYGGVYGFVPFNIGNSGLTFNLSSVQHLNGSVYDLFVFNNSGTIVLAAGPAWTNTTTRSAALTRVQGLWVNNATITLTAGGSTYTNIPANQATYLGSFYCTANGQTTMQFNPTASGGVGTANVLGLFNAYNQVPIRTRVTTAAVAWSGETNTWRPTEGDSTCRATFLDGLSQSFIEVQVSVWGNLAASGDYGFVGINLDSIGGSPRNEATVVPGTSSSSGLASFAAADAFTPLLGVHYVQSMEWANTSGGVTFYGSGAAYWMLLKLNN